MLKEVDFFNLFEKPTWKVAMYFFWVVTPCRFIGRCQLFGDKYVQSYNLPVRKHGVITQKIVTPSP
jgi:hypothetical protein